MEKICGGNSCSIRYCDGETCRYKDGKPSVRPIYISASLQNNGEEDIDELVSTLAHEIYHYTQPNGPVKDTLYEEFTAYYIGAAITQRYGTNFKDYNPM